MGLRVREPRHPGPPEREKPAPHSRVPLRTRRSPEPTDPPARGPRPLRHRVRLEPLLRLGIPSRCCPRDPRRLLPPSHPGRPGPRRTPPGRRPREHPGTDSGDGAPMPPRLRYQGAVGPCGGFPSSRRRRATQAERPPSPRQASPSRLGEKILASPSERASRPSCLPERRPPLPPGSPGCLPKEPFPIHPPGRGFPALPGYAPRAGGGP